MVCRRVGAVLFVLLLLLLAYGLGLRALFRNYIYDKRWVVSGVRPFMPRVVVQGRDRVQSGGGRGGGVTVLCGLLWVDGWCPEAQCCRALF